MNRINQMRQFDQLIPLFLDVNLCKLMLKALKLVDDPRSVVLRWHVIICSKCLKAKMWMLNMLCLNITLAGPGD